jgi:two-component system, sensor histidine kinase and response regulator
MPDEPIRVLLIEDNPGDARLVTEALAYSQAATFEVHHVDRLAGALAALSEGTFDMVLLDLSLPDSPPAETVERVIAVASNLPVLVLTGLDDERFSREAVKRGAQDYLVKGQFDVRLLARSLLYAVERKRITEQLARARDAALEASATKSSFLANMSHEIRTPMNAIIGMTRILLDSALDSEQREFGEAIWSSSHALLNFLNRILDFTKISSGKLSLEEIEFSPSETVESVIELFAEKVHGGGVELVSYVDGEVPIRLRGDPLRLRQVLINLVGNAIKFTERGEVAVLLRVEKQGADAVTLHFTVRDTGVGIPHEAQRHLFEAFYQAARSTAHRHGGTGLGLAISAEIVELMGGNIGVESEPGRGSRFWFTADLRPAAGAVETGAESCWELWGTRVLVADRVASSSGDIRRQLNSWGIEAETAVTGRQAIEMLRRAAAAGRPFEIALINLQISDPNGLELCRALQLDPATETTRVVAMYPLGRGPDEGAMREAGVCAWLSKPVRQSRLFNCLADALATGSGAEPGPDRLQTHRPVLAPLHNLSGLVPERARARARILLAEDHEVSRRVVLRILDRLGYHADSVSNGREAMEAVRGTPYDVILMDCLMPEMDGYEATREIRREFATGRRIAIIGVTAHAFEGDRQKCLDAGMDDYLSKPIMPEELAGAIARWLPREYGAAGPAAGDGAATPECDGANSIDLAMLENLELSGAGGRDFLEELISVFLNDLGVRLITMKAALDTRDAKSLALTAHALKGSCGHFGAEPLMALCGELEARARASLLDGLEPLMARIEREGERVRHALDECRRAATAP